MQSHKWMHIPSNFSAFCVHSRWLYFDLSSAFFFVFVSSLPPKVLFFPCIPRYPSSLSLLCPGSLTNSVHLSSHLFITLSFPVYFCLSLSAQSRSASSHSSISSYIHPCNRNIPIPFLSLLQGSHSSKHFSLVPQYFQQNSIIVCFRAFVKVRDPSDYFFQFTHY